MEKNINVLQLDCVPNCSILTWWNTQQFKKNVLDLHVSVWIVGRNVTDGKKAWHK